MSTAWWSRKCALSFQDLLDAELIESHVSLTCVSNPVGGNLAGNAKWLGMPIRDVLKMARPKDGRRHGALHLRGRLQRLHPARGPAG